MPIVPESSQRQRLLEAAGDLFAEHGFHHATVRQICRRAGANLAAIKYHFGDKAGLYREVLIAAQGCAADRSEPASGGTPEQRLRQLVGVRLLRIFDASRPAWQARLLAREMVDPTPALDVLVSQQIRPRCQQLEALVRELLGPGASAGQVRLSALSIIGQCLFYYHARTILERLFPTQSYGDKEIDRLADHITAFSLRALHGTRRRDPRARRLRASAAGREA
jgi:AcrR family transcriptional regulator